MTEDLPSLGLGLLVLGELLSEGRSGEDQTEEGYNFSLRHAGFVCGIPKQITDNEQERKKNTRLETWGCSGFARCFPRAGSLLLLSSHCRFPFPLVRDVRGNNDPLLVGWPLTA